MPDCRCIYWLDADGNREERGDDPNCPWHHPKEDTP